MNVVAVGYIIPVSHALYCAKALLQALCKLIGRAFKGSTVERVVNILRRLPFSGVLVKLFHNFETEFLALGFGKLFAYHTVNTFPKSRIAEG